MKKIMSSVLACLLLTEMLTGCAGPQTGSSGSASSASGSGSASQSVVVPPEEPAKPPKKAEPIDFTWNPVVCSDYLRRSKGREYADFHRRCMEAMVAGETEVPCADEKLTWDLHAILQSEFPPVNELVREMHYEDGALHILYRLSEQEHKKVLRDFGEKIESYIEGAVCEGDTPTMAAIALYHNFCKDLDYDYEAAESDEIMDVSPYRALMTGEGICQSFGPAYAYLCLQLGINAVGASGMDAFGETCHEWTIMELNGRHYFTDPTYEDGDTLGGGLRFFGMNAARRERDNYPTDEVTVGFNLMDAKELDISDDSFAPLWNVEEVYEIRRTPEGMTILSIDDEQHAVIPVEDGKTITVEGITRDEVYDLRMGELYGKLMGKAWVGSDGWELAVLRGGVLWVNSPDYKDLTQCWLSMEEDLYIEMPDNEYKTTLDGEELVLHGENGEEIRLTRGSQADFDRMNELAGEYKM